MPNERSQRHEDSLSEDEIASRILRENNLTLLAGSVVDAVDVVDGSSQRILFGNSYPVPRPRNPVPPGTTTPGGALFVLVRRRQMPLGTALPNSELSEEESERRFSEKRAAYLEEYLIPSDLSLELRLTLCAELMNLDIPINQKYVELELFRVMDANKEKTRFLHLAQGLGILEKYASNLLKDDRPAYWRTVKFTSSIVQTYVGRLIGSRDILRQMGYTQDIVDGVSFPPDVMEPNINKVKELAADLFFARYEIDALLVDRHPYLELDPPIPQEEVELPQLFGSNVTLSMPQPFPPQSSNSASSYLTRMLNQPWRASDSRGGQRLPSPSPTPSARRQRDKEPLNPTDRKMEKGKKIVLVVGETAQQPQPQVESEGDSEYEDAEDGVSTSSNGIDCRICGQPTATEFCIDCKDTFCTSCDCMYHRHPSRVRHNRRTLVTRAESPSATPQPISTPPPVSPTKPKQTASIKVTTLTAVSGTSSNDEKPRERKPPVPAPRRNLPVKSPPQSPAMPQDVKKPEPRDRQPPYPHPPRLHQEAPDTQQTVVPRPSQQPRAEPKQPAVPMKVQSMVPVPGRETTGIGRNQRVEPQALVASSRSVPVSQGREIRRPPPFITHNTVTTQEDVQQHKEDGKIQKKMPPAIPPKPQVKSSTVKKTAGYQGPASPEEDMAVSCPNCFCLNSSDVKTCIVCKSSLAVKSNQPPSAQSAASPGEPSWKKQSQHPVKGGPPPTVPKQPSNQMAATGYCSGGLGDGKQSRQLGGKERTKQVETPVDPTKQWKCEFCTYLNPVIRTICEVCCKSRTVPTLEEEKPLRNDLAAQQFPSDTQTWSASQSLWGPASVQANVATTNLHSSSMYPPQASSFVGNTAPGFLSIVTSPLYQQAPTTSFPIPTGNSPILQPIDLEPPPFTPVDSPGDDSIQRKQEEIYVNGKCYVEWLKQGELEGFSPEEVNIASVLGCDDPEGPIHWLKTAWYDLMHTVMTQLAVPENSQEIGNVSPEEVREALIECTGIVSEAVKKCIDDRKNKVRKLQQSGVFAKTDCILALDDAIDVEKALFLLEKMSLEPMLKRVLDSCLPDTTTEEQVVMVLTRQLNTQTSQDQENFKAVVTDQGQDMDRRIRAILVEKELPSWGRAETAIKLIDMAFSVEDSVEAAHSCGDLTRALRFLQHECPLCMDVKSMTQMFTFLHCQDRVCRDCVAQYVTIIIRDRNIMHLVCPICALPNNLDDDTVALEYFNNLDIVLRGLVDDDVHDLFQRKIRDRTLMKEPNFRWCSHCSSGFINEQPGLKMMCPHCNHFTCFKCKRQWEDQHEGITCEQFTAWKEANDPEFQAAGLAAHLRKNGIECPNCKFRYDLSKGGCMHFKCGLCAHEFCSGCYKKFSHGGRCGESENCDGKGLHAHHPRDCYFYLRDRQPEELLKLLHDNNVQYNTEPPETQVEDDSSDDEIEPQGAAAAPAVLHCKVSEQKETANGMIDEECGKEVPAGFAGLCKVHFIEYLVVLVNDNLIDPADIMSSDDLKTVLMRGEVEAPVRPNRVTDDEYHALLLQTVKQELPLPQKPPRKRILDDEVEIQPQDDDLIAFNFDDHENLIRFHEENVDPIMDDYDDYPGEDAGLDMDDYYD